MNDYPPPYGPHHGPGYPPVHSHSPSAYPGSSYQTFPQSYAGPPGPYMNQPGCQGYQGDPHHGPHGGPYVGPHGEQLRPNTTVVVVEQQRPQDDGGAEEGFMAACYAALCCCCLMDMLSDDLSDC